MGEQPPRSDAESMPPPPVPSAANADSHVALTRDVREALFKGLATIASPSQLKPNPITTLPDSTPPTPMPTMVSTAAAAVAATATSISPFSPHIGRPISPPPPISDGTYPSVFETTPAIAPVVEPVAESFAQQQSAVPRPQAQPLPSPPPPPSQSTTAKPSTLPQAQPIVDATPITFASPTCDDAFMPVAEPISIGTTSSLPQTQSQSWGTAEPEPFDLGGYAAAEPISYPSPSRQQQQAVMATPIPIPQTLPPQAAPQTPPPPAPQTPQTPSPPQQPGSSSSSDRGGIPNDVQHRAWLLEELRNLQAMGVTIPIEATWDTPMAELERLHEYAEDALNDKVGTDLMFFGYVRLIKAVEVANSKLDPVGRITGNKTCLDGASDRIMQDARLRDSLRTPLKMIYRKHFKTSVVTEASPFMQLGLVTWDLLQQVNAENAIKARRQRKRQQQRQQQQQQSQQPRQQQQQQQQRCESMLDEDDDDDVGDAGCDTDQSDAAECADYMPGDDDFDPTNAPDTTARPVSKKPLPAAPSRQPPSPTAAAAVATPRPSTVTFAAKPKPASGSPISAKPSTCDLGEGGSCPIVPMTVVSPGGGRSPLVTTDEEFDITIPMSPAILGSPMKRANK